MTDIWTGTGTGIWQGWRLTTDHAASSYGQPVLVSPDGRAYDPGDIAGHYTQADLAKALGVTRAAIAGRVARSERARSEGRETEDTLPPFDEGKSWRYETIRHLLT